MATTTQSNTDDTPVPQGKTRADRQLAAHSVGDPPRRTMAIGRVWIIGIVCLVVGALLNAPGIRKTALGQEVGWRRDVATFLADPLYDVSHALMLDRPRDALQDILGRSGQDDVDVSLPSPTLETTPTAPTTPTTVVPGAPTAPSTTPTTTTVRKPQYSPTKPLRLWVGGDSLSITPGESVINLATLTGVIGITSAVDGHVATGLARPEVFNWAGYMNDVLNASTPDLVVLTLGSNDDQALTGENGVGGFGSDAWRDEYRRRVGGLMDFITAGSRRLVWVGVPPVRNTDRYYGEYVVINDIARREAEKRPGKVVWIDPAHSIGDGNAGYTDAVSNPDGSIVQVRAGDGIHFTRAGGDRIAAQIMRAVNDLVDLTSWQSTTTTTGATPTTTKGKASTTATTRAAR